jgi:hypothetical protein
VNKEKNVISVTNLPSSHTIGEMSPGESGYTVPWAYKDGVLNEDHSIGSKDGTMSLRVECVSPGEYAITYEKPKYDPVRVKIPW